MPLRVLLLQARNAEDPMKDHELRCFVERCGPGKAEVRAWDLLEAVPSLSAVRSYDALMVGGSGDFYVSRRDLPTMDAFDDLLREVVSAGHPTFASCFGYQAMVHALGGEVVHDPENTEVGTYELQLTVAGREDELFSRLPARFTAQMGHKDRAGAHPDGVLNLAASEACPFQALRIADKSIWATQFHPELSEGTNRERYEHYLEGYSRYMSAEEEEQAASRFGASPDASSLLEYFVQLLVS